MKILCIVFAILFCAFFGHAQKIYIERTPEGYENPIINKLLKEGYKITFNKDSSDYTIICLVDKAGMGRGKAAIAIVNSKTGDLISKSKEVGGQTSLFNGYENPKMLAMHKIANNYLIDLIKKLKKGSN